MEETQQNGSVITREASRMRRRKKNKKKQNKKKRKVPKRVYYYDSDKGSEERVPDYEDYVATKDYTSDLDKIM